MTRAKLITPIVSKQMKGGRARLVTLLIIASLAVLGMASVTGVPRVTASGTGRSTQAPALAVLQPSAKPRTLPQIGIYPPGQPPYLLTTDTGSTGVDTVENEKVPVGWMGSSAVGYGLRSGPVMMSPAVPLYVQRINSPRRVMLTQYDLAAAPAPAAAELGALEGSDPLMNARSERVYLAVHALNQQRSSAIIGFQFHSAMSANGFGSGHATVAWSPDGRHLAAAWLERTGVRLHVCRVDAGPHFTGCTSTLYRTRVLPDRSTPIGDTRVLLAWSGSTTILVGDTVSPYGKPATTHLVALSAADLANSSTPALGAATALPGLYEIAVAPNGRRVALVESRGLESPLALQIAAIQRGHIVPIARVLHLGTANSMGFQVLASAPQQTWSPDSRTLIFAAASLRRPQASTIWRLNATTGKQTRVAAGLWVAIQPHAPAGVLAQNVGACSPWTPASQPPTAAVRASVLAYLVVLRQALAMANGSCLYLWASGARLRSDMGRIRTLQQRGETLAATMQVRVRSITIASGSHSATATVSLRERDVIYRGARLFRSLPPHAGIIRYALLPRPNWIVDSARVLHGSYG